MSVNKLKNAWISTDTGASGYSLRNEGTTLLVGTTDLSGQTNINGRQHLTQTGYQTVGKRLQFILDATTVSATLDATDSGAIVQVTSTNGNRTLYLPPVNVFSSMHFHIYVPKTSASAISLSVGIATSNSIRPAVQSISYANPSLTSPSWYVIQPGQAVYVYSDAYFSTTWLVSEVARNNVENVWMAENAFRGELTVLDASGVKRSLKDLSGWCYYDSTEQAAYLSNPAQDATVYVGPDGSVSGENCVSIGGTSVYLTSGTGAIDIGGRIKVRATTTPVLEFTTLPTYTGSANPTSTQFITKAYGDAHYTLGGILGGNNSWTGTNDFSISPTYSGSATPSSTSLITKAYADAHYGTTNVLGNDNSWTGNNAYSILPTYSGSASPSSTSLITKTYVDGTFVNIDDTQTITGSKTFSSPPTMSGANISTGSISVDAVSGTALNLSDNQIATGWKTFDAGGVVIQPDAELIVNGTVTNDGTIRNEIGSTVEYWGVNVNFGQRYNRAYNTITVGQALTAADVAGRQLNVQNATDIQDVYLPAIADSAGVYFWMTGDPVFGVLLLATPGDHFRGENGVSDTVLVPPGGTVYIQYSDTGYWLYSHFSGKTWDQLKLLNNTWSGTNDFLDNLNVRNNFGDMQNLGQLTTYLNSAVGSDQIQMGSGDGGIFVYNNSANVDITSQNVVLCGENCAATIGGTLNFTQRIPTYSGGETYSSSNQLITQGFADSKYVLQSGAVSSAANNSFSGQNTFNNIVSHAVHPTYQGVDAPTLSYQYTTKAYVDGTIATQGGNYVNLTSNQTVGGVKTFQSPIVTSGASIQSGTIPASAMSLPYVDTQTAQSIDGVKTFTSAPVLSGISIQNGTIADSALAYAYVKTEAVDQTIAGGKTFSSPPVMSGANITAGSIPTSAVAAGFVDTSTTQTIGGAKTFSSPPSMSGANITSGTIPTSAVAAGFVNTSTTQTIGGAKTFTSPPSMSGANIYSNSIPTVGIAGTAINKNGDQTGITGSKQWTAGTISMEGTSKINIVNQLLIDASGAMTNTGTIYNIGDQFQKAIATYTTSQTLPSTLSGRIVNLAPDSTGVTFTLPSSNSTNNGYWYIIQVWNFDITLATTSPNLFYQTNTSSVTLKASQVYYVNQVSNYDWIIGQQMFQNYTDLTTNQTIAGVKTFSSPPVMSGASISAGTIPNSALSTTFVDTSSTQTVGGAKTFSSNTTFNGTLITSNAASTTSIGEGTKVTPPNSVFVGYNAGSNMNGSSGGYNTVVGHSAHQGAASVATDYDTAVGWETLKSYNTVGGTNTAIGARAGMTLTSGTGNSFFGAFSGQGLVKGQNNLVVGQSMTWLQAGSTASLDNNICVGTYALNYVGNGCNNNTAIGNYGLYTDSYTTGSQNTAVGSGAGIRTNGSYNTFLGACGGSSNFNTDNATYSNCTTVGYGAIASGSNQIVLGRSTETVYHPGAASFTGAATFSTAPTMSGANISAGTIPNSALSTTFVDTSTTQTIGGAKTFSVAPVMSGANITTATMPKSCISDLSTIVQTAGVQYINGTKTFQAGVAVQGTFTLTSGQSIVLSGVNSTVNSNTSINGVFNPYYVYPTKTATFTIDSSNIPAYVFITAGTTAIAVTLPSITSAMVGVVAVKCKRYGNATTAITASAAAGQTVIGHNTLATPTQTGQPLIASGSYSSLLVAQSTTQWAVY